MERHTDRQTDRQTDRHAHTKLTGLLSWYFRTELCKSKRNFNRRLVTNSTSATANFGYLFSSTFARWRFRVTYDII